jgi:glutamyl-Q tRNA(Asp) synthetase
MSYVGRFAPSPTGPLHFGSLVAALASYLDAKAHGGKWLVRIEDIDETRCKAEYAAGILSTLQAFGMQWDGEVETQSMRKPLYAETLRKLKVLGLTYGCVCSRKEIADSATAGIEGPVYPGTCRNLKIAVDHRDTASVVATRVKTSAEKIGFTDLVQGEIDQCIEREIGDFVLQRRDGPFAYQLAVVVDDAAQGITHVVRGADLLDSTARQIYLQKLLGLPTPQYMHIPLAVNAQGQKLSKQTLAESISGVGGDVRSLLLSALRFLGQPVPELLPTPSTSEQLARSSLLWDRRRIPQVLAAKLPC